MNKDLHNMDDIFNSAYQQFEEEPSEGTWDKINASLDKKDAEKYKRRFIGWRRVAVILIFLVSGFSLYESGIIKIGSQGRNNYDTLNKKQTLSDSSLQNDNDVKITPQTDKSSYSPLPDNKNINSDQPNSSESIVNQQKNSSEEKIKNTIFQNGSIESDQSLLKINKKAGDETAARNKLSPSIKNNNLDIQEPKADNNLTGNIEVVILPATKKNNDIPEAKRSIANGLSLSRLLDKKAVLTYLSDHRLSKSIAVLKKQDKEKFKPYWTATGFASNDWANYNLDNDIPDNTNQQTDPKNAIAKRERHESSLSAGLTASLQVTKHIGIKSGLVYSNTSIVIDPQKMYAEQEPNGNISYKFITSSGYAYVKPGFGLPPSIGDSLNSRTAQHILQSLSIPLQLGYKFEKKKISITPSAGITANFITRATVETEVEDPLNRESVTFNGLKGLKDFNLGFIADVSLQYKWNNRWAVSLLPTFKYALSPITKKNVVKTYPYSFGLGMAFNYRL